jgi:hypothetical protein
MAAFLSWRTLLRMWPQWRGKWTPAFQTKISPATLCSACQPACSLSFAPLTQLRLRAFGSDWEAWEATWGFASGAYRNASIALARSQNPGKSESELEALAAAAYTNSSVEILALTARTSQRLRPKAKVGFYGLPHKQYWPQPQLNATQQGYNDLMLPLWQACSALYPSIYLPYESGCHDAGCQPLKRNQEYVDATIGEALRVSKLVGGSPLPVLPYAWYRYARQRLGLLVQRTAFPRREPSTLASC